MPEASADTQGRVRRRLSPLARRELIKEAATTVFAKRGYEVATMQDIASAAGVVASVLYDHYPSKQQLYVSLLEEHGQKLMERTIRTPKDTDPQAELRHQVDDFLRAIEADPFVWRMLFRDPPADPAIAATHERVQRRATEAIADALEVALASQPIGGSSTPPNAALVAEMVKSSLIGLAAWWWEHREAGRANLVLAATALLWNGLSRIDRPV